MVSNGYVYKTKAVRTASGKLTAFGISKVLASLYGHKESEIIDVELVIDEDQTRPTLKGNSEDFSYWGWYDVKEQAFSSFTQDSYIKLWICFPAGIEEQELRGSGKAYRLKEKVTKHCYMSNKSIIFV